MKLRAPAIPLITVDPYFNIWSMSNRLSGDVTRHWTGKQHRLTGILEIDKEAYCFMGISEYPTMNQEKLDIDALSTRYVFSVHEVELSVNFVTPLLMEDPALCARPITYMETKVKARDGIKHQFSVRLIADDEMCLNEKGQWDTAFTFGEIDNFTWGHTGSVPQNILNKSGDDLCIDWGYLYLAAQKEKSSYINMKQLPSIEETATISGRVQLEVVSTATDSTKTLIVIAYDDNKSIEYFGEALEPLWRNAETPDMLSAISVAFRDYPNLLVRCNQFSDTLYKDAKAGGGIEYAELLALAYRQSIAAHKLCAGPKGELLFISKECFSNGCAATVDVSYPSAPLFLLYNTEFVKGMLRPIFRYAASPEWPYDFAPHDVGQYPLLNGQVYGENKLEYQMPIEECGNILVMMAAICTSQKDVSFALESWPLLEKWAQYLLKTGMDPENQLCTDDFAGHLAHNCNLSIKAIMGITGFAILCSMKGSQKQADELMAEARKMADQWLTMAAKADGTYRLAFDQEDSFSMKYNLIWDKLWGTKIFDLTKFQKEFASYLERSNEFGMPLDNRADYTKSDWLLWCATLMETDSDFKQLVAPLYAAYQNSSSRVPMTDWYDTKTATMIGFQNRTVQGGLFIRLLEQKGLCFIK